MFKGSDCTCDFGAQRDVSLGTFAGFSPRDLLFLGGGVCVGGHFGGGLVNASIVMK